jgi:putative spermidine/putrescine transport system ATP-binding protein
MTGAPAGSGGGTTPLRAGERPAALELRSVAKVLGRRRVVDALDLEVASGELVCILGPSGCGKTTTLRMVAGFLPPDEGRVFINGRDMTDLSAQHRPTAMVFQNYALWPHMSVLKNVTFGLRSRGMPRAAANERAREALTLVGLERHATRLPGGLSGGEQQRVALARAMVLEPTLLLMDEPLSNLDAQLRLRMREELAELQQRTGVTMIFVTHDQDEALSIAHRVAVMSEGRLDQVDPPAMLYRTPATAFVAGFVGRVNVLAGAIEGANLRLGRHCLALSPPAGRYPPDGLSRQSLLDGPAEWADGPVEVAVRPEEVKLVTAPWAGAGGAFVEAEVVRTVSRGHFAEVLLETSLGSLRAYVAAGDQYEGRVGARFGRLLLYRSGRLVGTMTGETPLQQAGQPEKPGQDGAYAR